MPRRNRFQGCAKLTQCGIKNRAELLLLPFLLHKKGIFSHSNINLYRCKTQGN